MSADPTDIWDHTRNGDDLNTRDKIELFDYLVNGYVDLIPDEHRKPTSWNRLYGDDLDPDGLVPRSRLFADTVSMSGHSFKVWIRRVPASYVPARVDNLDPKTQHRDTLSGFLTSEGQTLFLAGPIGTGKSYAAYAVGHLAAMRRWDVQAWSVPRLLLAMRPDGDPNAFENVCAADLLILDDLAAAKPTDWATEQMYSIAEARSGNNLRTVITTNGSYESLCQMWGDPTMDRWRNRSVTCVFEGKSRREPLWT